MASILPINRGQRATTMPIPAPVGGLNSRDALAAMPPGDASVMSNLFPLPDRVVTRGGYSLLSTKTPINGSGKIEGFVNLMTWGSGSAADTLFASYCYINAALVSTLKVYSVATDGTLTESLSNGCNNIGEWVQFGSASGTTYLFQMASTGRLSPSFAPNAYDGSSWTVPSITGVPSGTRGVNVHRNRLWFYNAPGSDALNAFYLPVGAIAGTVVKFSLAPFATRGGRIVAMRTWTRDGGEGGSDDLAAFFTNRGQAIIYSGTDPASPASWSLVGIFDLGIPASYAPADQGNFSLTDINGALRDSFALKYGSDLLFVMQSGITSANMVLTPGQEPAEDGVDYTISAKINPTITDASKTWVSLRDGNVNASNWKVLFAPALKQLLVSVPTAVNTYQSGDGITTTQKIYSQASDLYVMNTVTGAWTKFTGFNIRDMIAVGSNVYFTDGSTRLYKYDGTAADDAGTAITFECRQAYNYLGMPNNKQATLIQPMLNATGDFSMTVQVDSDFNGGTISSYTSYTVGSTQNLQPFLSPAKMGRAFATHLKGQTSVGVVSWYATNYIYKPAGII